MLLYNIYFLNIIYKYKSQMKFKLYIISNILNWSNIDNIKIIR